MFHSRIGIQDTKGPVGWSSLAALLDDLDAAASEHEEIFDTQVRERMWEYLEARFIRHEKRTPLPDEFGMFSSDGNNRIRDAFQRNTENLDTIIEIFDLDTVDKRRITFTNPKLISEAGSRLDSYFGSP